MKTVDDVIAQSLALIRKAETILEDTDAAIAVIRKLMAQLIEIDPERICPHCRAGKHERHSLCVKHCGCRCKVGEEVRS